MAGLELSFHGGQQISITGEQLSPALQYGPSDGDPRLLPQLLAWHREKDGIGLPQDGIVVLNGAQEGLFIAGYLFLDAGDSVVVSEPTYPGALSAFSPFTDRFLPIALDKDGLCTADLEERLRQLREADEPLPKLIYTIPSGHNPGGVSLSPDRRRDLLRLASEYDLLVLEDDPYQLVRLDDAPPPETLQSLDRDGRVIRLDSFSKIFAPGLRVGYASGDPQIMHHFLLYKQSANLHTSSLTQHILAAYLEDTTPAGFRAAIKENCRLYRENRDEMVAAARELLPAAVRFNVPQEGLFIWFELPQSCDAASMVAEHSRALKILLVPGSAFSSSGGCHHCMRASFSMVDRTDIRDGMQRFAEMIRRAEEG